ncbi:MAG: aminotransferase class V-fold PLP-dependent enzyme, partial [Georgenia sp.]
AMRYPSHQDRAPESDLKGYLEQAEAVLTAATPAPDGPIDHLVSADFEQLRWFDLPPACLAAERG